jgi:hypothetical protein
VQLDKSLDLTTRPAYLSSNSRRATRTWGGSGNGGVMRRYVAFLRGVNPMNAKMAELRRCFETAGFTDVRTVLSSGNVQISPDFVVKFQPVDIAAVILWLVLRLRTVN